MSLSEVNKMALDDYFSWLEYFSILNGGKGDETEEKNNDLVAFLRSKKG